MSRPLKVLFVMEDLCYGGTQKQNLALARNLDKQRFSPIILTLTGPTDLDNTAANVPVNHLGRGRRPAPFFFLQMPKAIKELNPDIMVACTALPNIWGRIWGKLLNIPVIVGTCRGGGAPIRQHEWLLGRFADGIVCNSLPLRQIMLDKGLPEDRVIYIANGVDTEHFKKRGQLQNGQVILSVARLAKDKDQISLLEAFGQISSEFPDARLCLVGEGPEEETLRSWCKTRFAPEIQVKVEFAGASADPAPYYNKADIFALSSLREGQPNVILEAMSCGLPICATSVGGIPDLVKDNGLLSPPKEPGALAENLRKLLLSQEMRLKMGAIGRSRVENDFSFAAMTSSHENFFQLLWDAKNETC